MWQGTVVGLQSDGNLLQYASAVVAGGQSAWIGATPRDCVGLGGWLECVQPCLRLASVPYVGRWCVSAVSLKLGEFMGGEERSPHRCSASVLAMAMMMSAAHEFRMWHRKRY